MIVNIARLLLIYLAILAFPIYAAWVFGGWCADKRYQRKRR